MSEPKQDTFMDWLDEQPFSVAGPVFVIVVVGGSMGLITLAFIIFQLIPSLIAQALQ